MNKRGWNADLSAKLVLALLSLCLTLSAVELILRSITPRDLRNPAEFRIPHPVLGWALEPGASYRYKMPEEMVTVTYNSQGWHDREHDFDKPEGVFRILILGDSFMEGYSVELDDTFHSYVQRLARVAGSNSEVINFGVGGYGTLQEYLAFRNFGKQYAPDLVLLGFFDMNDLIDNSLELSLMLKPEGITTVSRPYLDPSDPTRWKILPGDFEDAQRVYMEQQASLDAHRNNFSQRLVFLSLILDNIGRLRNLKSLESEESAATSIDRDRHELVELGVNYCDEPDEFSRAWGITERILARLKEDVASIESTLVVFSIPSREEVSIDYMNDVKTNLSHPERLCLEELPGQSRLSLILTKLDIEYIDLFPVFRRVTREDGTQLYRVTDLHWNPDGHSLAAEWVVSELISRALLHMSTNPAQLLR